MADIISELEVAEGLKEVRRGEGLIFSLTTTNWESTPPTPKDIVITRLSDATDVTTTWTTDATPSGVSDNKITLTEITIPTNAETGIYRVDLPFSAGGFDDGIPFVRLKVIE